MFWWFERSGAYLRCEVLELSESSYELRVVHPDGSVRVEVFTDARDLAKRQAEVEGELRGDGWTGPHGWVL